MNLNKYIEYFTTKVNILYSQKAYKDKDQVIKYILQENRKSNKLLIILSGCTRTGIKARYNYVRTLKDVSINKLFILDNQGSDGRGIFYLGKDNKFDTAESVKKLIYKVIKDLNIKDLYFCGSSKGGYASLYFGLQMRSTIIIGAPQYYLGNYLNCDANRHILKYIVGDINESKVENLNNLIYNNIKTYKFKEDTKLYIQYSGAEHTYDDHIKDLIRDLRKNEIKVEVEELNYKNHSDVSIYFPKYLQKTLHRRGIK